MNFPKFSIRDMVESQHRLLTQVLHISHLRAVMWHFDGRHADLPMDHGVSGIYGSRHSDCRVTRLTSYDLLLWNSEAHAIETDPSWQQGNYKTIRAG